MGRRRHGERRTVALTLPEHLWDMIDTLSAAPEHKTAEIMREIIQTYFEEHYSPITGDQTKKVTNKEEQQATKKLLICSSCGHKADAHPSEHGIASIYCPDCKEITIWTVKENALG